MTVLSKSLHSCISHSCICSLVCASSAPNGSSSRMTSVSNSRVRSSAARWRMPPDSEFGIEIFEAGKAVALQQRQRAPARFAQRHALDLHAEDDVVEHGAPGQQQVLLQHVADAANGAGGIDAIDHHAAGGRLQQPGDDVEDRALAAARRSDQADEAALRDRQRRSGASASKTPVGVLNAMLTFSTRSLGAMRCLLQPGKCVARNMPARRGKRTRGLLALEGP